MVGRWHVEIAAGQVNEGAPLSRENVKKAVRKWAATAGPNDGHITVTFSANDQAYKRHWFYYRLGCKSCRPGTCQWRGIATYDVLNRSLTIRSVNSNAHGDVSRHSLHVGQSANWTWWVADVSFLWDVLSDVGQFFSHRCSFYLSWLLMIHVTFVSWLTFYACPPLPVKAGDPKRHAASKLFLPVHAGWTLNMACQKLRKNRCVSFFFDTRRCVCSKSVRTASSCIWWWYSSSWEGGAAAHSVCVCNIWTDVKPLLVSFLSPTSRGTIHVLWAMVQRSGHSTCG